MEDKKVEKELEVNNGGKKEIEKDWKYFWGRVLKDMTNRDLFPVKVLFFFKYATLFVLYPFLTIHMSELGLEEWEIGVNQATAPIVAIMGPPFVGILADKIGNFKLLLAALTMANAGMALLLLLVPKARENIPIDPIMTFDLSCTSTLNTTFILKSLDPSACAFNYTSDNLLPETNTICGQICPQATNASSYPKIQNYMNNTNPDSKWFILPDGIHYFKPSDYFKNITSVFKPIGSVKGQNETDGNNSTRLTLEVMKSDDQKCPNVTDGNKVMDNGECQNVCLVQFKRRLFCSNFKEQKIYNVALTFGLYTAFRLLLGFASATSFIMFEGAVLAIMKQHGGDYGLQRITATLAAIVAAPTAGLMLSHFGFRPVICLYAGLKGFSAIVTLGINLDFKKPAEKVIRNLKDVLSQTEIIIFFCAMLWSGTLWGYLETFLFLYLERMGGSRLLMGLTITVGGVAGLPLLIFSRPIIKRLGHVNVLILGLLFYAVRNFGYSIIDDPWQALIFEAGEAITVSLAITAASTYAVALSNLQTIASIQGIMGCLYFGIGRGAGSLLGGFLIHNFGHVETFQIFGVGSLVGALLYFLLNIGYLRKHSVAHKGLDLNNLNNMNHKSEVIKSIKNKTDISAVEAEEKRRKEDFAYEGPLSVNKFTDVPLDEEAGRK